MPRQTPDAYCDDEDTHTDTEIPNQHPNVDHGYAWVVMVALFLSRTIEGMTAVIGIFNVIFLEVFGHSKQSTAWIFAFHFGLRFVLAPVASVLIRRVGARPVLLTGTLLCTAGYLWASHATSFSQIFIAMGIMAGAGGSPNYIASSVLIRDYFQKNRNFAYGFVSTGIGVGALVFPVVIDQLLDSLGWRGTIMMVAGIYLQKMITVSLLIPQAKYRCDDKKQTEIEFSEADVDTHYGIAKAIPNTMDTRLNECTPRNGTTPSTSCCTKTICVQSQNIKSKSVCATLLRNKNFYCMCTSEMFGCAGYTITIVHFVAFAIQQGTTLKAASYLLLAHGIAQTVGRFGIGLLTNRPKSNILLWFSIGTFVLGLLNCLVPTITRTFTGQAIYLVLYGFCLSTFNTLSAPVMITVCDTKGFALGLGICTMSGGVGSILGPPFAGILWMAAASMTLPIIYSRSKCFNQCKQ